MVVLDSSPPTGEGETWVRNTIGELDPAGPAFRQLQGILTRFRNCDSFEITGPKVRSWADPGHLSGQEAIAVIIRTIIEAKRSVHSLKVCLPDTNWVFRRPGERYIEADGFIERTLGELEVSEVWAGIQELAVGYVHRSLLGPSAVLRLLEPAKQLQSLSLGQHEPKYWDSFVGSAISTPMEFQLRSLTIHRQMLVEDPAEPCLKDFVYRQRDTLETVRFADVHLSSLDSWRLVLNILEGCLHLEEIPLDRIGVDVLAKSHARFAHGVGVFGLCKRRDPNFTLHRSPRRFGLSVIHGVSYAGPKMQAVIRSIGLNMRLP